MGRSVLLTAGSLVLTVSVHAAGQAGRGEAPPPAGPATPAGRAGQGGGGRGRGAQPPRPAKAAAPIDLTGYWVAIISKDWRWRMLTPAKGDYVSIPINLAGKTLADTWDPAKDEAAGELCKSYGAPGLIRAPTRLHLTWQGDDTLKFESDYGTQTRLFHFGDGGGSGDSKTPTLQGDSVASWEVPRPPAVNSAPGADDAPPPVSKFGNLKVVTTHLKPGYLRKNGVPYSDKTTLTEYWDVMKDHAGTEWLVVTAFVDDPTYLQTRWITSLTFKREADGARWDPTPCSPRW